MTFQFELKKPASPVDYTPSVAVVAGQVVCVGNTLGVAALPIAADAMGSLHTEGVGDGAKVTGAWTDGQRIYWDPTGDPVGGTAGTGAFTTTAAGGKFVGYEVGAATSGATTGRFRLVPDSGRVSRCTLPQMPVRT